MRNKSEDVAWASRPSALKIAPLGCSGRMPKPRSVLAWVCLLAGALYLVGCGGPNKANIELRKHNQDLKAEIERMQRQHEADAASIAAMEKRSTTVPVLGNEQAEKLFTVSGLEFGRLTGVDPDAPTSRIKVFVVPIDQTGDTLKAAGAFVVDVFDLSAKENNRVGHAEFPLDQAGKRWFGKALLYTYVLPVKCDRIPTGGELTVRVKFTDGLTGREFSAQRVVKIQ